MEYLRWSWDGILRWSWDGMLRCRDGILERELGWNIGEGDRVEQMRGILNERQQYFEYWIVREGGLFGDYLILVWRGKWREEENGEGYGEGYWQMCWIV